MSRFVGWTGATTLLCMSCTLVRHDVKCPADAVLAIASVGAVVESVDQRMAKVTLQLQGHGVVGTRACLGYPWEIRGDQHASNEARMVIGSHGPCATEAMAASSGDQSEVTVDVMTNDLKAGLFSLKFPVIVVNQGSSAHCGEVTSPQFFLATSPGVH